MYRNNNQFKDVKVILKRNVFVNKYNKFSNDKNPILSTDWFEVKNDKQQVDSISKYVNAK